MNTGRFAFVLATLASVLAARPALAEKVGATVATSRAARGRDVAMHKIAFGVRAGQASFALDSERYSAKGVPVDNWNGVGRQIVPTFCVGGDGYFVKFDFPIMKVADASSYGFGLYPINFGHLFKKTGLFPFLSAGAAASILTLPGQGISGASAQARGALGLKVNLWHGLGLSAEVGYSPFVAAALVDKQKMHDLVQGAIDGQSFETPVGSRPARGGMGRGVDFLVGVEWM
jgi:hypothetical protein